MKNKSLITLSQISITFLFFVGICICLWWYPFSISFSTIGLVSGESSSSVLVDQTQTIAFWSQLIFSWIASVPCFVALVLGFRATIYAKCDEFFSKKNAKIFNVVHTSMTFNAIYRFCVVHYWQYCVYVFGVESIRSDLLCNWCAWYYLCIGKLFYISIFRKSRIA